MTDKEKIRNEVERLQNEIIQEKEKGFGSEVDDACILELQNVLTYIGSLQEEPVKDRLAFKAIPRLLDMIEPSERAKNYVTKLADAFDAEGYHTDAKIVRESLKILNGEKLPMATMDEDPVSEDLGEYIYELSKRFPEVSFAKLSRIAVRVAKWKEGQLKKNRLEQFDALTKEEAQREYDFVTGIIKNEHRIPTFDDAIKYGMRLQKEQMMAKAIDGVITNAGGTFGYDVASFKFGDNHSFQVLLPTDRKSKFGDKVKVIVIKED